VAELPPQLPRVEVREGEDEIGHGAVLVAEEVGEAVREFACAGHRGHHRMRFGGLLERARIDQERSSGAGVPDPSGIAMTCGRERGALQERRSRDESIEEPEPATDRVKLHLWEIGCIELSTSDSHDE
jgi:hypothetical protein